MKGIYAVGAMLLVIGFIYPGAADRALDDSPLRSHGFANRLFVLA